jgi:prevent-host-death family protein
VQIAVADAETLFDDLIRRVESGENIVLTRHGKPVAWLTGTPRPQDLPLFGALKGRIRFAQDFDTLPDSFADRISANQDTNDTTFEANDEN